MIVYICQFGEWDYDLAKAEIKANNFIQGDIDLIHGEIKMLEKKLPI